MLKRKVSNSEQNEGLPKMNIDRWTVFTTKEKEGELQELIHSSYWQYLPKKTQEGILTLLSENKCK